MSLRACLLAGFSLLAGPAMAQSLETVVVYGTLPQSDIGQNADKVPGTLQSFGGDAVRDGHGASVLDTLGTRAAGVGLSDTQGNGMFQDLRYHGFQASPLQGAGQGVAVYQNGVRLNEAFGDTVNWDTIPEIAIARMDLWSGNPVFGLNALGGAINVLMKNGFTAQGGTASAQGGSYGHAMASAEYGVTDGDLSLYAAAEGVHDDGWRLHSGSNVARLYLDGGWRFGDSELHLAVSGAQSLLGVVGPTPVQMIARDERAVYTWPQTTANRTGSVALNGKTKLNDHWQIEGAAYMRALKQRHVDGNDGDFERCSNSSSYANRLCLEDDGFPRPAPFTGAAALNFRNQFVILNQTGASIPFTTGAILGTVDHTATDSVSQGFTLQVTGNDRLFGLGNYFTAGGSLDHSAIGFRSTSTLGRIFPDLSVQADPSLAGAGSIIHAGGNIGYAPVDLGGATDYYGVYAMDALDLTDALTLTAGLRFNSADINTRDRAGTAPELNGSHTYSHANVLAGLTYKLVEGLTLFGNYSEANRAPTPLELDCADPLRPCLLEGSLVSDPPLKQVVNSNAEIGARGMLGALTWSVSLFRADSDNDIVALASTIQGRGYYTNVPLTRREGVDAAAAWMGDGWSLHGSASYLDATYRFTGALASPNNPSADAAGNVTVRVGNHLPLNPAWQARLGGDWEILPGLTLGADFAYTGSQYFDGDNANQNAKLPEHSSVDLRVAYDLAPGWQLFVLADNLFDDRAAAYGAYFEPGGATGLVTPALTDPRTLTLQPPATIQAGVTLKF